MEKKKGFFSSRTNLAALAGLILTVLDAFGVDPGFTEEEITDLLYNLGQAIAYGLAIWSRVMATKQIKVGG